MSSNPKVVRRPTKRPVASKSIRIDQEYSNIPGCSFSNNLSSSISPENYTLSSLKIEIEKSENGIISKNQAFQLLQYHRTLLEHYRSKFSNIMMQAEHARLSSRPEQTSRAKIIDYNPPLRVRSGYPADSPNSRPTVTISSAAIHGSSSSANLLSISRSHTTPLASSASTASISLISQRSPSSPASTREKTRSSSSEANPFAQAGSDQSSDAIAISSSSGIIPSFTKNDESNIFLANQDPLFRTHSDPTNGINSVSFSSSSAAAISNPPIASIPRSMSASHFSRNSNSSHDGKGEKGPSSSSASNSSNSSTKSMTALTIWNNVNKFFVTVPTVEQFQQRLQISEPPDANLPLGPHYSIGINQKLKQKYKNGSVQLRIPPEIIAESPEGVTSIIFHRLLASFVSLDADDLLSIKKTKTQYQEDIDERDTEDESNPLKRLNLRSSSDISSEIDQQINPPNLKIASGFSENIGNQPKIIDTSSLSYSKQGSNASFTNWNYISDYSNIEQYPVNIAGTSVYSMCPFEQKLVLEVQSLNLVPEPSGLKMTDNEVMNDIIQKRKELKQIKDENNKMKTEFLETLKSREKELLERKEKSKKWGSVSFKVEQGQKKDLKRPKKRDKLI